jgi:Molybdenum cofactor biosynthesis enzyme
VLNERNGRALIDAGLDELRVSLDASNAKSYLAVRGKDYFNRILKNVRAFRDLQEREGKDRPRVSAWLTGLKETIAELRPSCRSPPTSACGKSICSAWYFSKLIPSVSPGPIRDSTSR